MSSYFLEERVSPLCNWPTRLQGERQEILGNVSETPTHTTCLKSTAVRLQFVRQYAPHLYRRAFLASKLRRKGDPAIRLPFKLQYASHLYGSTFGKILGVRVTGTFLRFIRTGGFSVVRDLARKPAVVQIGLHGEVLKLASRKKDQDTSRRCF